MELINLTPHSINIVNSHSSFVVEPSGVIARVTEISEFVEIIACNPHAEIVGEDREELTVVDSLEIVSKTLGQVENLPEPKDGVLFVVSAMVRLACAHRFDVVSPGDQVRDANGKIIGCKNLVCNEVK